MTTADDAAARATKKMMEAAGLQVREGLALEPEAIQAGVNALIEFDRRFESEESAVRRIVISVLTARLVNAPEP